MKEKAEGNRHYVLSLPGILRRLGQQEDIPDMTPRSVFVTVSPSLPWIAASERGAAESSINYLEFLESDLIS